MSLSSVANLVSNWRYMMRCCTCPFESRIQSFLRDYDSLQSVAVILIYIQIGCALVGSLGALYNGVLLINLAIALFALVAIESGSQSLGRTYAVLLFCSILLDICWLALFFHEIWNLSREDFGIFIIFSVKLTLGMEIIGFSVRFLSSFLWIQMYRMGVPHVDSAACREADFDLRNSFLNPTTTYVARESSVSSDVLGGSIYDPAYYSSLFEDGQGNENECQNDMGEGGCSSAAESSPQLKAFIGRSFQAVDVENQIHNDREN